MHKEQTLHSTFTTFFKREKYKSVKNQLEAAKRQLLKASCLGIHSSAVPFHTLCKLAFLNKAKRSKQCTIQEAYLLNNYIKTSCIFIHQIINNAWSVSFQKITFFDSQQPFSNINASFLVMWPQQTKFSSPKQGASTPFPFL